MKYLLLPLLLLVGCNEKKTLNRDHPDGPPKEEECFHEYEPNDGAFNPNFVGVLPSVSTKKICGYFTPEDYECVYCQDTDYFWFPLQPGPGEENIYLYIQLDTMPENISHGSVGVYQSIYEDDGSVYQFNNLGTWYFDEGGVFVDGFSLPYEPGVADDLFVAVYGVIPNQLHIQKRLPYTLDVWTN